MADAADDDPTDDGLEPNRTIIAINVAVFVISLGQASTSALSGSSSFIDDYGVLGSAKLLQGGPNIGVFLCDVLRNWRQGDFRILGEICGR